MPEFRPCPSCGSSHLGGPCGLSFRDRLASVRVDVGALETRTRVNYYDPEPTRALFGEGADERMMDATEGYGYTRTGADGEDYHRNRKTGDWERVPDDVMDRVYLGGRTERPADEATG